MSFTKREFMYLKIDPIQLKLFDLVKSTDICILSYKRMLNRSISMEVRFNTSHCHGVLIRKIPTFTALVRDK